MKPSELVGKQFLSTELHEAGLGPDGLVMGHWRLTFSTDFVAWDDSDVRQTVDYRLASDGALQTSLSSPDAADAATNFFLVDSGRIFWQGQWYQQKP